MQQTGFQPVDDPRSPLQRARRRELLAFARANKVTEIKHDMPAPLMRKILARHGLTNIRPMAKPLGEPGRPMSPTLLTREAQGRVVERSNLSVVDDGPTVDAEEELERTYREMQQAKSVEQPKKRSIAALRNECKARGLKPPARSTAAQLEELLNG